MSESVSNDKSKSIRKAAIDLIRRLYYSDERIFYDWQEVSDLMEAIEITVDKLTEVTE